MVVPSRSSRRASGRHRKQGHQQHGAAGKARQLQHGGEATSTGQQCCWQYGRQQKNTSDYQVACEYEHGLDPGSPKTDGMLARARVLKKFIVCNETIHKMKGWPRSITTTCDISGLSLMAKA
jgi:hypothetical protein